jgi:DNA-binding GntR family transcriptional regulator
VVVAVDVNDPRPAYQQIAADISRAIEQGRYAAGERLPSGRELAKTYGVAPMTIQQAIRELRDLGVVVAWQGRGVFVRGADEPNDAQPEPTLATLLARLEAIHDDLQSLEARVADLETRPPSPRRSRPTGDAAH